MGKSPGALSDQDVHTDRTTGSTARNAQVPLRRADETHLPPEGSAGTFLKTDHGSGGPSGVHSQHPELKGPPNFFFFLSIHLFSHVRSE